MKKVCPACNGESGKMKEICPGLLFVVDCRACYRPRWYDLSGWAHLTTHAAQKFCSWLWMWIVGKTIGRA